MKVEDLIDKLSKCDKEAEVLIESYLNYLPVVGVLESENYITSVTQVLLNYRGYQ